MMKENTTKTCMGHTTSHAFGACGQAATAIGLAGLLAWHSALSNYLFAPSAGMAVSPLFAAFFSASLLVAYCYASYRTDSTLLSHARLAAWFIACIVAGSVAACLVAARLLPTWSIYVAAVITGFSWASCAFLWAGITANSSLSDTFRNLACALVLASAADIFFMHGGDMRSTIAAPFFGAVSLAGFLTSLTDSIIPNDQILVRPQNTHAYMRIGTAATLFAGALGVTAGSTAHAATETGMAAINENVSLVALIAGVIALGAWLVLRERATFIGALRIFVPVIVGIMLLNIVALDRAQIWLAATLFSWRLLCIIMFGLLISVSKRGVISLALIFPAGWSVLCGGYALGILVGQSLCPLYVTDSQGVFVVVVGVAMTTVIGAMLLFGGNTENLIPAEPSFKPAPNETDSETTHQNETPGENNESTPNDSANPSEMLEPAATASKSDADSLDAACSKVAETFHLTERESEVMMLLVHGHTRAAIAKKLFISENTARAHAKSIYSKLGVHSKQQLIDYVETKTKA